MSRDQLLNELEMLFRQISKKFREGMSSVFNEDVTVAEFFFLRYLAENGPVKPSDISSHFNVSLSHVTALADRMVLRNFVHRTRNTEDRRIVELSINEEGRKVLDKLISIKRKYVELVFKDLTDQEVIQLIHIYKKLSVGR